jgi:hypothetical protein
MKKRAQLDTNINPPRTTWVHPYEDDQYLFEHPEIRKRLGKPVTVKMLTLDVMEMVCVKLNPRPHGSSISLNRMAFQDITRYIQIDQQNRFDIGHGASANVVRGIYRWRDPTTQQMRRLDVSCHIQRFTYKLLTGAKVVIKCLRGTPDQHRKIQEVYYIDMNFSELKRC